MKNKLLLVGASILAFPLVSYADINFNGFATMTGGMTTSNDESTAGYDDTLSFDQNSLLGLQAKADLGDGLTAVAQIVSRGKNSWDSKLEWAYLGYQVNDNIKLLAGRQVIPFYTHSDYIDVGYTYHWITPPEEVYALSFNSLDGIGVIINNELGPVESRLHLLYGRFNDELPELNNAQADVSNFRSVAWTLEYDWLTVRMGHAETDMRVIIDDLTTLGDSWTQAGATFSTLLNTPSIARDWDAFGHQISSDDDNNSGTFDNFAITADYNDYVFSAEYVSLNLEGVAFLGQRDAYYISFGKRFGSIMPHITVGGSEETPPDSGFLDTVPSGVSNDLDTLVSLSRGALSTSTTETSFGIVGVRWDFHSSAALKVDFKSLTTDEKDGNGEHTDKLLRVSVTTLF